jgi:hypothetical protein
VRGLCVTPYKIFIIEKRGEPGIPREKQHPVILKQKIDKKHKIVGREDAEDPPDIKIPDADGPILLFFGYQQAGDQEPADHKKHIHSEIAIEQEPDRPRRMKRSKRACRIQMVEDDYKYADRSKTIEARYIVFHLWIGY